MNRPQSVLTFSIGYPYADSQIEAATQIKFVDFIVRHASSLSGGCTVFEATGYWREDGANQQAIFLGKLEEEQCLRLELTCEPEKLERAVEQMKSAIMRAKALYGIDTQWVHLHEHSVYARHFEV